MAGATTFTPALFSRFHGLNLPVADEVEEPPQQGSDASLMEVTEQVAAQPESERGHDEDKQDEAEVVLHAAEAAADRDEDQDPSDEEEALHVAEGGFNGDERPPFDGESDPEDEEAY